MDTKELVLQRLDKLIKEANDLLALPKVGSGYLPADRCMVWYTSCKFHLPQLLGDGNPYCQAFLLVADTTGRDSVTRGRMLLERVREEYASGGIRDLRDLAAAEVFTDFLGMAQHLHNEKYHHAAVSIAGAVLEDCLRRVHLKRIGDYEKPSSINKLNMALYNYSREHDPSFYPNTQRSQVEAWGTLRNEVDHGRKPDLDGGDAGRMIDGVRDFVVKYEG
jgi:hypothetical protein